jgi:hypothetical protein
MNGNIDNISRSDKHKLKSHIAVHGVVHFYDWYVGKLPALNDNDFLIVIKYK